MNDNFNTPENEFDENFVSGVEKAPKKKKGLKIAAVGVGVVAVAAGGGVIAYNTSDYVKNQVKLATLEPDEYYAWVGEKNSNELADSVAEAYEEYLEEYDEGISSNIYLEYKTSDEVKDSLVEELFGTGTDSKEDQQLIDVINNMDTVTIGLNAANKSGSLLETFYASLNDEKLISLDIGMNQDLNYFGRIPELNEKWLGFDFKEIADTELDSAMLSNTSKFFTELSPKDLSSFITRYSAAWYNSIDDVKLEKDQKVKIGALETEYTVLTSEVGEEDAYKISESFIKTLSEDKLVKELIVDTYQLCDEDEYSNTLGDILEQLQDMREAGDFDEEVINLITYVDAKGTIRGIEMNAEDAFDFRFVVGADGDKSAGELSLNDIEGDALNAVFNAEKSGASYDGEFDFEFDGNGKSTSLSAEFSDISFKGDDDEYISGDLVISVPGGTTIPLTLSTDGESQTISYDVNIDNVDCGTLNLVLSSEDEANVELPDSDDVIMIDEDFDVDSYISEDQVYSFIEELFKKIGFSSEYAKAFADEIYNEIYSSVSEPETDYDFDDYDDYDDYDDFDDYDYDDYDDYDFDDYDYDDYDFDDDFDDYDYDDFSPESSNDALSDLVF